jgi:hypothetical protein
MSRETIIETPPTESDLLQEVYRRVVQIHYPLAEGVGLTEREKRCYQALTDLLDFLETATYPSERLAALERVARLARRAAGARRDLDGALADLSALEDRSGGAARD